MPSPGVCGYNHFFEGSWRSTGFAARAMISSAVPAMPRAASTAHFSTFDIRRGPWIHRLGIIAITASLPAHAQAMRSKPARCQTDTLAAQQFSKIVAHSAQPPVENRVSGMMFRIAGISITLALCIAARIQVDRAQAISLACLGRFRICRISFWGGCRRQISLGPPTQSFDPSTVIVARDRQRSTRGLRRGTDDPHLAGVNCPQGVLTMTDTIVLELIFAALGGCNPAVRFAGLAHAGMFLHQRDRQPHRLGRSRTLRAH